MTEEPEKEKLFPHWTSDSFNVVRPVYLQEELHREADYQKPVKTVPQKCGSILRSCGLDTCIKNVLPIVHWLPTYSLKNDLMNDIISGCTIAVMHIPQGMGYAMLSGSPPIVGIYMAFFPVLVYFFFGTSRHISMGTFAIICLMVGKAISAYATINPDGTPLIMDGLNPNDTLAAFNPDIRHYTKMDVGTSVCLVVGIYQLLMWVFRLGAMSSLLSEPLVSGFIAGATMHVMSSQLKDLVGITLANHKGYAQVIKIVLDVGGKLPVMNWAAFTISVICIGTLLVNNEILKPILSKYSKIPVPIELILVVTGTLVSKYCDLSGLYDIKMVGHIPTGIPAPNLPPLDIFPTIALDCFTITMVSYTVTMSMALIFATQEKYEVDANQELLAMGAGNIVGGFFSCLPFCASLSRSSIQHQAGGRTQLASVVSCGILLCVLLWIGPFFEVLPKAVLASIIVVALKGMMLQTKEIVRFWKLSKLDALVWLLTFSVVILVDIDFGLLVGMLASVATLFIRAQSPYTCVLGCVPNTDIYLDVNRYKAALEIPGIKIFHYCGGLNFATKNGFKATMFRKIDFNTISKNNNHLENGYYKQSTKDTTTFDYAPHTENKIQFLIMDLTAMCYMDAGGVGMLRDLHKDMEKMGIQMLLARANGPMLEMMEKFDKLERGDNKISFTMFPSVHDAVLYALSQMQMGPSIITNA